VRIILGRLDAKRYATVVERDDGVRLSVPGYGFMRPLPHDLAHYVVESVLRLDRGFWGSVATGAKLRGMQLMSGRQKPHADRRSKEIEKANDVSLSEAERLVACFEAIAEDGVKPDLPIAAARLKASTAIFGKQARAVQQREVAAVCATWLSMLERWDGLPIGDSIQLDWPVATNHAPA
jgi:hypothetical protein